ncbi:hypothetical protein [Specibacter sp. RAF43]|uniref:hypothetical protein n=1 Tax=Specibacter sp. RAF43 TaxID=3233057 RepID=UPI003F9825D7
MARRRRESVRRADPASPEEAFQTGFVSVDDGGDFTFHASAAALLGDFEYPDEAACIVDRRGAGFRLTLDAERRIGLAASPGEVDLAWLGRAWAAAQRRNPLRYPVRRFYPAGPDALLSTLFECLYMDRGPQPHLLPAPEGGEVVVDPFGHLYRPARMPGHRAGRPSRAMIFIEIAAGKPPAGARQASDAGRPTVIGMPVPGVAGS